MKNNRLIFAFLILSVGVLQASENKINRNLEFPLLKGLSESDVLKLDTQYSHSPIGVDETVSPFYISCSSKENRYVNFVNQSADSSDDEDDLIDKLNNNRKKVIQVVVHSARNISKSDETFFSFERVQQLQSYKNNILKDLTVEQQELLTRKSAVTNLDLVESGYAPLIEKKDKIYNLDYRIGLHEK